MLRTIFLEWFPVLAMPGFAFGFGFGPQGPKSTTQGSAPVADATTEGSFYQIIFG